MCALESSQTSSFSYDTMLNFAQLLREEISTLSESLWDVSLKVDHLNKFLANLSDIGIGNYNPSLWTWNGNLNDTTFTIEALGIHGSSFFKLPLKSADVGKLMEILPQPPSICKHLPEMVRNKGCLEIDGSFVTLLPHSEITVPQMLHNLTKHTVEKMLNIDFDYLSYHIEAKVEKLVICEEGGFYESSLASASAKELGKFGTLFLQIPVNYDYINGKQTCGNIVVTDGKVETHLSFSNKNHSVAAVAGGSFKAGKHTYKIKSDAGEVTVMLVFSMVWRDYMTIGRHVLPSLNYFPHLLISTHNIKSLLLPWKNQINDTDATKFFCLPVTNFLNMEEKQIPPKLSAQEQVIETSLRAITFLDVNYAKIAEKGFKQGVFSPFSIKDELFSTPVIDTRNFPGSNRPTKFVECPVFVVRPRNPNLLSPAPGQTIAELLLESLEGRLNFHPVDYILVKPTLHKQLMQDLEQIFDMLEEKSQLQNISCKICLFTRVFNICTVANASPQRIMNIFVKLDNVADFFIIGCDDATNVPTNVFFEFMCQTNGWETCVDALIQIADLLSEKGGFRVLSETGINLLHSDKCSVANEMFRRILKVLKKRPGL